MVSHANSTSLVTQYHLSKTITEGKKANKKRLQIRREFWFCNILLEGLLSTGMIQSENCLKMIAIGTRNEITYFK